MVTRMIGSKIAEARKKLNISQAQLSQRLFISPQAVGKWERGESMPDITTFIRLTEVLGVDLNYFSEGFQSDEAPDVTTAKSVVEQSVALPSVKLKEKLSWDMSQGNWLDADFSGLTKLHEKFSHSNMQRCIFTGSDIPGLLLKANNVDSCDFSDSNISDGHILSSHLDNNIFKDSSLKAAEFSKSYVKSCDFSGSDLSGSHSHSTHFTGSLFKKSSLNEAEFLKSHVEGCDFSFANFNGVSFKSGGFQENIVTNAVWNRSSFTDTQITDIVFDGSLKDCYFEDCIFNWVKFQNAILTNTFFKNNRFKRIKFVACQADRITYELLKSGKADVSGITLLTI